MTFTSGPQSQPVRFQSQFPATSPSLNQRIVFFFIPSTSLVSRSAPVFIPSCRSRPPLSPAQDCASFPRRYSSSSIGSIVPSTTSHAFASRTGIVSLKNSVQIRKAKFKVVQKSDHGRLTYLRKNQMGISYRPRIYTLHRSARRGQPCLFISLLLPFPLWSWTTRSVTSRLPPMCHVVGSWDVILDRSLS
jgi:hypothetical protein